MPDHVPGILLTAAATVEVGIADLDAIIPEIDAARIRVAETDSDLLLLTGAGGLLHGFYSRFERLLRDISVGLHGESPSGDAWHARLLDLAATDVPGFRPPMISPASRRALDEFRAFRHVFRNVYVFHLDPERVVPLLGRVPALWAQLRAELFSFAGVLRAMAHTS